MVNFWGKSRTGVEPSVPEFLGEDPGIFSFCHSFYTILFRYSGSVILNVSVEIILVGGLSVLACLLNKQVYEQPETLSVIGHQIFGVMLSFLIVLRSQIAWGMYAEGRGYLGDLITGTRNMGLEVIATLCANQITIKQQIEGARARQELARAGGKDLTSTLVLTKTKSSELHISPTLRRPETAEFKEDNLVLAHEIIRMLKLFYFCVVEHLRSSEGTPTWKFAHDKTRSFATRNEWRELLLEFGKVQPNAQRQDVKRTFHFKRFNAEDDVTLRVVQDPTRAKPLLVLAWVRMALERGVSEGLLRDQQLTSFSAGITKLGNAVGGTHKVDTMVLPFPYAQLLLWSLFLFCFTLPFFVVTELDWATIPACMCITLVFYGLNEVGTELEQPFGVDPNDFPLIRMGDSLAEDLDALLRTANKQRVHMRHIWHGEEEDDDDEAALSPRLPTPDATTVPSSTSEVTVKVD